MKTFRKESNRHKIFALCDLDRGIPVSVFKDAIEYEEANGNYEKCQGYKEAIIIFEKEQKLKKEAMKKLIKSHEPFILLCGCSSREHQVIIEHFEEENIACCHIYLESRSFFRRLVHGLKYIFGYKSCYGAWDEFVLTNEHASKLKELADLLERNK
jgi:hypothetical protein